MLRSTQNQHSDNTKPPVIHIILDIDDTLANGYDEKNIDELIKKRSFFQPLVDMNLHIQAICPHILHPGAIELIQWILSIPNVKLSFFSGGDEQRNILFVEELLRRALGDAFHRVKDTVSIFSRQDLVKGNGVEGKAQYKILHLYHGQKKKDLKNILKVDNLDNVILVEDDPTYIAFGQARNVLITTPSDFDGNLYKFQKNAKKYPKEMGDELLSLNHIFYIAGMLSKITHLKNKCLADNLFDLQYRSLEDYTYERNKKLYKEHEYYLAGLSELQKVNPNLNFYGGEIANNYFKHPSPNKNMNASLNSMQIDTSIESLEKLSKKNAPVESGLNNNPSSTFFNSNPLAAKLRETAAMYGFEKCIQVKGDGNCMLYAILDQFKLKNIDCKIPHADDFAMAMNLRKLILSHMEEKEYFYEKFFPNDDYKSIADFSEKIKIKDHYLGHLELVILSKIYKVNITIIKQTSDQNDFIAIECDEPKYEIYLGLEYHGDDNKRNHYHSLVSKFTMSNDKLEYKRIINKYAIDEKHKEIYLRRGELKPTVENYGFLLRQLAAGGLFPYDNKKAIEVATLAGNFDIGHSATAFAEMAYYLICGGTVSHQELEEAQLLIEKACELDPNSKPGKMVFDTAKLIKEIALNFTDIPKPDNSHSNKDKMRLNEYYLPNDTKENRQDNFFSAAMNDDIDMLDELLKSGIDINATSEGIGANALHHAIMRGNLKCAKFLIDKGIEVNAQTASTGSTAVHYAVTLLLKKDRKKSKEAILLLAQADAHFGIYNYKFKMPRDCVSLEDRKYLELDHIEEMRAYSASQQYTGNNMPTTSELFDAVRKNDTTKIKQIVNSGIPVNSYGKFNKQDKLKLTNNGLSFVSGLDNDITVLHIACLYGHINALKTCEELGAHANFFDSPSLYDCADKGGNKEVSVYLTMAIANTSNTIYCNYNSFPDLLKVITKSDTNISNFINAGVLKKDEDGDALFYALFVRHINQVKQLLAAGVGVRNLHYYAAGISNKINPNSNELYNLLPPNLNASQAKSDTKESSILTNLINAIKNHQVQGIEKQITPEIIKKDIKGSCLYFALVNDHKSLVIHLLRSGAIVQNKHYYAAGTANNHIELYDMIAIKKPNFNGKEPHEILGVSIYANMHIIKKAYKELTLKYHPDKSRKDDAGDKFKQISRAYEEMKKRFPSANSSFGFYKSGNNTSSNDNEHYRRGNSKTA